MAKGNAHEKGVGEPFIWRGVGRGSFWSSPMRWMGKDHLESPHPQGSPWTWLSRDTGELQIHSSGISFGWGRT